MMDSIHAILKIKNSIWLDEIISNPSKIKEVKGSVLFKIDHHDIFKFSPRSINFETNASLKIRWICYIFIVKKQSFEITWRSIPFGNIPLCKDIYKSKDTGLVLLNKRLAILKILSCQKIRLVPSALTDPYSNLLIYLKYYNGVIIFKRQPDISHIPLTYHHYFTLNKTVMTDNSLCLSETMSDDSTLRLLEILKERNMVGIPGCWINSAILRLHAQGRCKKFMFHPFFSFYYVR